MVAGTNRLRELRLKSGKSQEVVSGFVCIPQSTYSGYENGRTIPTDVAINLAEFFKVSVEYLNGTSDDKHGCHTSKLSPKAVEIAMYYDRLSAKNQLSFDKFFDGVKIFFDEK